MSKTMLALATCAALAALLLLLLPGCKGEPLPSDKVSYAGKWQGDGVDLLITSDGGCSYHKVSGSGTVEVNAPIKGFDGDDFVVGVAFFDTTFDVTAPPHEVDGAWKMTVDGHELTRVAQ